MKSHKDWINRFLWISLFSAFLWGCSGNKQAYLGKYYVNPNRPYLFDFLFYKHYAYQTELKLFEDSTYYYETCAIKSYGKWKTDGKKVYLFCDTMFYKIDSFNYIPKYTKYLNHKEPVDTFVIRKNKLFQKHYDTLKKVYIVHRMLKVE